MPSGFTNEGNLARGSTEIRWRSQKLSKRGGSLRAREGTEGEKNKKSSNQQVHASTKASSTEHGGGSSTSGKASGEPVPQEWAEEGHLCRAHGATWLSESR